ncbi:MAG TPA: hypothetical protein VF570_15730 [Pyrinomonadaceae bacterium]|jgi:hypothetical protein
MDNSQFFVAQHYRDFFSREPDQAGLQFFTANIEQCGADAACREAKRIDTSTAFLTSVQFGEVGHLVYRFYKVVFGNLPGAPIPVRFRQLLPDIQEIGSGVVVNQGDWERQLEGNKEAFALAFVQRPAFQAAHNGQSAAAFVDSLFANAGVAPANAERQAAISAFGAGGAGGQAAALRSVAESGSVTAKTRNEAFVLMAYLGYLRRDPDESPDTDFSGYESRLSQLNELGGDRGRAEMVKAFITSTEYRQRFGQ